MVDVTVNDLRVLVGCDCYPAYARSIDPLTPGQPVGPRQRPRIAKRHCSTRVSLDSSRWCHSLGIVASVRVDAACA